MSILKNPSLITLFILIIGGVAYYLYHKPNYSRGEQAADFSIQIDGRPISLSSLKKNYILLDFWGSWCPPCLKESPDLVALYNDFHNKKYKDAKNFEIISIGIETDKNRWQRAIKKLKLDWPYHHSDLNRFKSSIALQYGVRSIPTKFLIDPQGNILSVNASFDELRNTLQDALK